MHHALRFLCLLMAAGVGLLALAGPSHALEGGEEILVGRISYIEGDLLRYVPEEKDWTLTVADAPFGLEDTLYSGDYGKAELILPNGTWLRINEKTQVQMIDLKADATTIDLASGQARLYNKSNEAILKATTSFGSVIAPPGAAFDLVVGDESLEVVALRGEVDFLHEGSDQRYPLREGGGSLVADRDRVGSGNGTVDGDWDGWNNQRESLWNQRQQTSASTLSLLPEPIRDEAYSLEENGRWERVYYDGAHRDMWRPMNVAAGWQPFTVGRWVNYYGDNCWIPEEPFGYLTHHYGSWLYVDAFRSWYWLPPVARRSATPPGLLLSFGWYPGRVGWFSRGNEIGWIPLAPNEDYYSTRHWGHRSRVIHRQMPLVHPLRYRYLGHACVIERDSFYRHQRYPGSIRRDLRKNEAALHFKPMTSWDSFKGDARRFDFGNRQARNKPQAMAVERIHRNKARIQAGGEPGRSRRDLEARALGIGADGQRRRESASPTVRPVKEETWRWQTRDRGVQPQQRLQPEVRERRPQREDQSAIRKEHRDRPFKQEERRVAPGVKQESMERGEQREQRRRDQFQPRQHEELRQSEHRQPRFRPRPGDQQGGDLQIEQRPRQQVNQERRQRVEQERRERQPVYRQPQEQQPGRQRTLQRQQEQPQQEFRRRPQEEQRPQPDMRQRREERQVRPDREEQRRIRRQPAGDDPGSRDQGQPSSQRRRRSLPEEEQLHR